MMGRPLTGIWALIRSWIRPAEAYAEGDSILVDKID
jgi:hypothetical protein